ncbi:MAG TPA: hypothetical protein VGD17_13700 [Chitinophagaceae bacterium]
MRTRLLYPCMIFMLSFLSFSTNAQTTLALGDIAFTGYNSGTTDAFSFVILRTGGIAAGTIIKFTDRAWWGSPTNACGTNSWGTTSVEEEVVWTAAVAIPYGRQIKISGLTATYAYGAPGTVTGVGINLSSVGDQIFAYQGTQTGAHTMIAGIHMNEEPGVTSATNWDNILSPAVPSGTQSNRPPCLVNGTHALFINPEVNNARLKPSVILSGNPATDRSRVNNVANWDVNDVTDFILPGALSGLPVEFTYIKAIERTGKVNVEWGIGTEEEIVDYVIEKSDDGRLYMELGVVPATRKNSYSFTDLQPANGNNFYRIRATEINGTRKYSTVAIVNLSKTKKGMAVYPTIVRANQFTLQLTNLPAGNYRLNLQSATGQLVFSRNYTHAGGSATQTITLPATVQSGVYKLNLRGDGENRVTTIVVE